MKKELNIQKIQAKFHELIGIDEAKLTALERQKQKQAKGAILGSILEIPNAKASPQDHHAPKISNKNVHKQAENDELIFTKSDICREVAKLKPYLRHFGETKTSVEIQDRNNKRIADEEQNCLSELVIYLNKELCEQLRTVEENQNMKMKRQQREKEGWVYEVFYRYSSPEQAHLLNKTGFKNGYAVLTEILQLFPNLTFEQSLLKININQLKRVKYFEQKQYSVIDIRFKEGSLHVAFVNETQMRLFDRMLFLLKNMARTSSTRLFQNQLLKNIYSEY